ncbi:MAG: DUF6089 family protein [Cyclobacteriaceae bacterium]|jgi:hypothetical protein|nr:DUF6089 family protein [Cyclobacteriaceae bacterium]
MKRVYVVLITLGILLVSVEETLAQFNRRSIKSNNRRISSYRGGKTSFRYKYNAVGFSVNALNYYGDLAPRPNRLSTDISFTRPGFGLSYAHRFGPRYVLMGNFMFGTLRGSDASADKNDEANGTFRYTRNLSFRNQIKEFSVIAQFDLFNNTSTYMVRPKWTPYGFIGIAGFFHNPQAQAPQTDLQGNPLPEAGEWVKLRPLGTEGQNGGLDPTDANHGIKKYSTAQIAIPFGVGVRFKLMPELDLAAEIGFRYTFTDYLDDVSRNYVDLDKLNSPLAQAMSYRTNELPAADRPAATVATNVPGVLVVPGYGHEFPTNNRGSRNDNDIYMVTSIRLSYILKATYHRPKFR